MMSTIDCYLKYPPIRRCLSAAEELLNSKASSSLVAVGGAVIGICGSVIRPKQESPDSGTTDKLSRDYVESPIPDVNH